MTAPVARQTRQQAPAKKVAGPSVPFPVASLRRNRQAFDTGNLTLGQNVSAIEIPAAGGFLRWIELDITGSSAGNSAAVAYNADAPFNALSFIEFLPPSGDPPIVPHTGYQLYLWNKYGFFSQSPPFCDPRRDVNYYALSGTGANGGSFHYTLRLPFEVDPQSGFCSITNSAANKSYLLTLIVNTSGNIYTLAPTVAPTVRVIGTMYYWDEPVSQTRQGSAQDPGPLGLGSFSQLRIDTPPLTSGDKYVKVNNAGPVMRQIGWVLRASNGTRASVVAADIPAVWDFVFNTRDRFLVSDTQLVSDTAEAFGYQQGTGAQPTGLVGTAAGGMVAGQWGGAPAYDLANGLDTSVRFLPYMNDFGGISPLNPRSQYQITADATLTQIRGISFGSTVSTMEILTNLLRPGSAAALYPPLRV